MNRKIGRFEILRELGKGAQSVVYLAHDPHLEREVAIKTMHFSRPDPEQNRRLLEEARTVSRMRHPNIVPIFEAGEEDGDLYLVFEFVPGKNLGEYLRVSGALSPVRAISVLRPVLEAIGHAHEMGVIHRDLKPTNILIDDEGMTRVMDFGIAARVEAAQQGGGEGFSGTPAYMAPEYIANRRIDARTDIFAAGLVFYELLTGRRAVQGTDVFQVMNQIANQDIRLPADISLDERITAILYRALARDPERRYASVAPMLEAMEEYLNPEDEVAQSGGAAQGTVEFLLRRMRHKSDFPALSESVSAINKITASDRDSVAQLSGSILKDFALTNKILKLVNSAYFRQAGGGSISTVSRAVMVLGFDAVRNLTITVLLFEHLQNKGNANQLKEEFLRANLAGILAKGLGPRMGRGDLEQSFICALFHGLGRLLTQFYFPEEGEDIRRQMEQKNISEAQASHAVLGVSFEELGIGIAQHWGFPPLIVNSMRRVPPGSVHKPHTPEDKLRVLSAFSNEICAVISSATPENRQKELKKVTARFGDSVPISPEDMQKTLEKSFEEITQFASVIRLNLAQTAFGRQIKSWGGKRLEAAVDTAGATVLGTGDPLNVSALSESPAFLDTRSGPDDQARVEAILTAGIRDISNSLVEDFALNDLLRIILETMFRAKGFWRVILCIKDARSGVMQGRFGFGPDAADVAKKFRFPLNGPPDAFTGAMMKGVDILITDIDDPKIMSRIPEWYRRDIRAGTFVLFPLTIKNNPVAMIYADMEQAGAIVIPETELSLLRTLRNQAVLAIKQAM